LSTITSAQSEFITNIDKETLFDNLLRNILYLTKSEYGFIGEISVDNVIEPVLKVVSVSDQSWKKIFHDYTETGEINDIGFINLQSLFDAVIKTGKPVICNNTDFSTVTHFMGLPFFNGKKIAGMVGMANRINGFTDDMAGYLVPFLTTCANIIEAYRNEQKRKQTEDKLYNNMQVLRKTLEGVIQTIALTVEMRDPYTAGHQRSVARIATAIAEELHLVKDEIDGIHMAGVIHDLGKIAIPGELLSKPGRLTEHEFGMLKSHAQVGYDILKTIQFPWPIAQMVYQHHERSNGTGYPQRLTQENIVVGARILAVADVVEAMASHRPYRPALGIDKALDEISKNKGVLYDSDVVDACLAVFVEKKFVINQD
jgi:hypothetical protein